MSNNKNPFCDNVNEKISTKLLPDEIDSNLFQTASGTLENSNEIIDSIDIDDTGADSEEKITQQHKRPDSLRCDNLAFPYNLKGIVSKEGDMTHFVTENLEYKIRILSPANKKDCIVGASSCNSTPSTSAALINRQFFVQQQSQSIDFNVLNDIEIEAQYLAASIDNLTENLCNLLHSISSITADNVEIHKNAVNKLTDSMDANIKCMYTIMAKTEEISKSMKTSEKLLQRIREIKRLVDMLEMNV